jgi:hypothetical protein
MDPSRRQASPELTPCPQGAHSSSNVVSDSDTHSVAVSSTSVKTTASGDNIRSSISEAILEESIRPRSYSDGVILAPKWRQYFTYIAMFVATIMIVSATICLAFLSSSGHFVRIFAEPENTIFILNLGSAISVFFIGELLTGASNNLRWVLAANPSGVGIATFLALGRATGLLGVLNLLFSNQNVGHRRWCGQR